MEFLSLEIHTPLLNYFTIELFQKFSRKKNMILRKRRSRAERKNQLLQIPFSRRGKFTAGIECNATIVVENEAHSTRR